MNQKQNLLIIIATALIAVGAVTAAIKQNEKRKAAETELDSLKTLIDAVPTTQPQLSAENTPESSAQLEQLQAEIDTLKEALGNAEQQLVIYQKNENEAQQEQPQTPERESYADRMARLKDEDPEEYQRIVDERRERQEALQYNLAERTAIFLDMDTSFMNPEELANHEQLVDKMATVFELTQQFEDPENTPNRANMREMWSAIGEARPLMERQRITLFEKTFRDQIGMSNEEAADMAAYIEHLNEATSINPFPRRNRPDNQNR